MQKTHCAVCGEIAPAYDIIHVGTIESGYREICTRCYNADMAKRCGLDDFENIQFDPIKIDDCAGEPHVFYFRNRLMGHIMSLEAFELLDGNRSGYQFQLIADPEEEIFALLGRLIQKMRRGLSVRHIEQGKHGLQIVEQTVRGRINSDQAEDGRLPLVIVDGREFTWDQLGEMMMTYEGWQFKLEIVDTGGEV